MMSRVTLTEEPNPQPIPRTLSDLKPYQAGVDKYGRICVRSGAMGDHVVVIDLVTGFLGFKVREDLVNYSMKRILPDNFQVTLTLNVKS